MKRHRLMGLLLGHTLAEGQPAGPLLRALPGEGAARAARAAEAGDLGAALAIAGLPADLIGLAARWPAALRPAQRRLDALPQPLPFLVPLLHQLGYLAMVALVQLEILLLLQTKVLPTFEALAAEVGSTAISPALDLLGAVALGDLALLAVLAVLALTAVRGAATGRGAWGWVRHLRRAREAALLASLHDSAAPEAHRGAFAAACTALRGQGATPGELDMVIAQAEGGATLALERALTVLRVAGYGLLTVGALLMIMGVYLTLPALTVQL
ncbi:MAG: hypothetical protein ABIO70_04350 [Pseudomonadota bacterium]